MNQTELKANADADARKAASKFVAEKLLLAIERDDRSAAHVSARLLEVMQRKQK